MLFPTLLLQLVCIISVGGKLACWESQEFEIEESCRLYLHNLLLLHTILQSYRELVIVWFVVVDRVLV